MNTAKTSNHNLVINWHLLEPCQLKCKYCYAQWDTAQLSEIYKDSQKSEQLISEIASLIKEDRSVRLSFAGGEPLLDKKLSLKIDYACQVSLTTSIITNGGLLDEEFLHEVCPKLSIIGVSIDSLDREKNLKIGRRTLTGKVPDYEKIIRYLKRAKEINPKIRVKVNTVVNPFNFDDDLSPLIEEIGPDKWKVLRVLPATRKSKNSTITDAQFEIFKSKHSHVSCAQFEDNQDMANSYLMLDPFGRFFFNSDDSEYNYSDPVLDVGIETAFEQVRFDACKFSKRYNGEVK